MITASVASGSVSNANECIHAVRSQKQTKKTPNPPICREGLNIQYFYLPNSRELTYNLP